MDRTHYLFPMTPMSSPFNIDGGIHRIPLSRSGHATKGGLWLCGKHHIAPDPEGVRERHGIDHIVCLVEEHELRGRYDDYVDWLERNGRTVATWKPVPDLSFFDLNEGTAIVTDIIARIEDGLSVLVHCAAGIGRAGTFAVATLMMSGLDKEGAISHVRSHRPMAGPESGAQQMFIEQLSSRLPHNDSIGNRLD